MREPNLWIGNLGHLLVLISFASAILATIGYILAQYKKYDDFQQKSWLIFARRAFWVHSVAVTGVVITLFAIVYNQMYEYFYAYDHSSNSLPVQYMIACFWEGQEGSFLIWIFWNVLIALLLLPKLKSWESGVMWQFSLLQVLLTSMILGVVFADTFKVGSSPFVLTREVLDLPVYNPAFRQTYNPNFIPADGGGLSPLLQNYWMVIHPPTIFLGFAITFVPFAFALAGLQRNQIREWIKPALPWTLVSIAILGLGIMMGAYWAYETLNFGGYWNWDPVENAVYVPWLTLVAALHTMLTAKNSSSSLKSSIILLAVTFFLVLYSTFLTRSGVLGDASVHSFTDLGLSGQLVFLMLVFVVLPAWIMIKNWKKIPADAKEITTYSPEFWTFTSAMLLSLAAFIVIFFTSRPVWGQAPPTNPMDLYGISQGFLAVVIAIASAWGQYYWWRRGAKTKKFYQTLSFPLLLTLIVSAIFILLLEPNETWQKELQNFGKDWKKAGVIYIKYALSFLVIFASWFSILSNSILIIDVFRKKPSLSGGAVAHIGFAVMILGIMYSAGYSKIISDNNSGLVFSKDAPEEFNKKNVLLWLEEPTDMRNYQLTYKGMYIEAKGYPGYINQKYVRSLIDKPEKLVVVRDIFYNGKLYFKKGDTIRTRPENIYYRVEYRHKESGKVFNLFPRVQMNGIRQGEMVASPDIYKMLSKDLYTHVSSIYPDPSKGREYTETEEMRVRLKDTFLLNDFVAILENVEPIREIDAQKLTQDELAVKAVIKILGKNGQIHTAEPILVVNQATSQMANVADILPEIGARITFRNIDTQKGEMVFSADVGEKDYIIMKAIEQPQINLLWGGSLIIVVGLIIALINKLKSQNKTLKNAQKAETFV
ncbi:cytochrome c biogenesis protein CcsA [Raineya orbicola]|uniref:Cytochrome C assembly protein n=1 Tax=Raineya orbicola TaxID=2016530 RepID=A0A2N3II48_9BACT|nr:cytochrome c biogenesis protein CcsA [Raineya orbicola]PKQ70009.1 Cytochrome C assembly protein [Raineya orbicola]